MARTILIVLLGFGAAMGFAAGFYRLGHPGCYGPDRRAAFEDHVADVCVRAAERTVAGTGKAQTAPPANE